MGSTGVSLNGVAFFNQYAAMGAPLTNEANGFDQYGGHPQQQGQYHYHIEPKYLTTAKGKAALLGFILDGFPVYGPTENGKTITNVDLDRYHGHVGKTVDYPNGIYIIIILRRRTLTSAAVAKRAQLRNKVGLATGLLLFLVECQPTTISIPNVYVSTDQPTWQRREGRLWLKKELFSGYQYQLWPNGDTAFVGTYSEGKSEGKHRFWYANHQPKEVRQYQNGLQEGEHRGWYKSGNSASIYHFQNDVYEGKLREWYPNGRPARNGNYHEGHENGPQRGTSDQRQQSHNSVPYYNTPDFTPVWLTNPVDVKAKISHHIADFSFHDQANNFITQNTVTGKIHVANFFLQPAPASVPR